jgi:hypothetical protein
MNIDDGPKHSVCADAGGAIAMVAAAAIPVTNSAALRFMVPTSVFQPPDRGVFRTRRGDPFLP